MKNAKLVTAIFMAITTGSALASTYQGAIGNGGLIFSEGTTNARVTINVPHNGSCSSGFFAYENADTGTRKHWTAALMTAVVSGKKIQINGSGSCDQWNIEGVNSIHIRP